MVRWQLVLWVSFFQISAWAVTDTAAHQSFPEASRQIAPLPEVSKENGGDSLSKIVRRFYTQAFGASSIDDRKIQKYVDALSDTKSTETDLSLRLKQAPTQSLVNALGPIKQQTEMLERLQSAMLEAREVFDFPVSSLPFKAELILRRLKKDLESQLAGRNDYPAGMARKIETNETNARIQELRQLLEKNRFTN